MSPPVSESYAALVSLGAIERDPAQERLVAKLDALAAALARARPTKKASLLGRLFGRKADPVPAPRGLYIHGAVGRGKTMLMDLFFEAADVPAKRRAHFHAFMADVHERIFAFRQRVKRGEAKDTDPIPVVGRALAEEATLICFDEFAVTDIADAMILGRLFKALFEAGVTVVATSNVEPENLYRDGLNRALFLPFIALMEERMQVERLDARTDFRLEKLAGADVYHVPADAAARAALDRAFARLAGGPGAPMEIAVKGRKVAVPAQAMGIARFAFADLCMKPLGAADYLAVAHAFHTILLEGVPVLDQARRNEAKRFITLIDILYENRVKLIVSAQAEAGALYAGESGAEVFEFRRTASRLVEMRSAEYLALPHGRQGERAREQASGLVET